MENSTGFAYFLQFCNIGVYLAMRNQFIANNSQVNIMSIGLSSDNPNSALQCITDKNPCCFRNPRLGEWYLPNGMLVQGIISIAVFHRNRDNNGEVTLNRPSDIMSPTGQFCCQVADATNVNQKGCIIIGKFFQKLHDAIVCIESLSRCGVHHSIWISHCWEKLHSGVFSRWFNGNI